MIPKKVFYARVLQLINEFLPVKEMAGRLFGVPVLRQFGLIPDEKVDRFLLAAFSKVPERALRASDQRPHRQKKARAPLQRR